MTYDFLTIQPGSSISYHHTSVMFKKACADAAGTTAFLATANNFVVNAHIMSHAGGGNAVTVIEISCDFTS